MGGISEEVNWQIADALALKSISAWRTTRYAFSNDNDSTELELQFSHHRRPTASFPRSSTSNTTASRSRGLRESTISRTRITSSTA